MKLTENKCNINIMYINNIFIIIILFMSVYFGRERSMIFDGADRLYEAIAYKHIFFGHLRFPTMLNGILPWMLSYIYDTPIVILWSYILNYTITPLLFFVIYRYFFKDEYLVTFFIVGLILFYTILFFHPNHDVLFSYYYTILLYSYLRKIPHTSKYYYYILFFLFTLFVFSHPSQVPSVVILLLYMKIYQKNKYSFIKVFSIFFTILAIKILIFSDNYEIGIYSKIMDAPQLFSTLFYSPLIKTFFQSFYTVNIVVTIVLIITSFVLVKSNKVELLFIILLNIIFTLIFITFFFQDYPYNFCTEGYLKGATLLLSIVFLDYFVYNSSISQRIRKMVLGICYILTIFIIMLNGINYKVYYNNIKQMSKNIKANTIYISETAIDIEQYYILHRVSALINLTENKNCNYFQYFKNKESIKEDDVFIKDVQHGKLCFGNKIIIEYPNDNLKTILDTQGKLIFELTNIKIRINYNKYRYNY